MSMLSWGDWVQRDAGAGGLLAAALMAPGSPIADFYPTDFECDLNGKKYTWQAVVLLPWIDEHRLLTSIAPLEAALTGRDKIRNSIGCVLDFSIESLHSFFFFTSSVIFDCKFYVYLVSVLTFIS
jgi:5'-3' exonuclease